METSSLERYIIISHYRYLVYNKCKNANSFRNSLFDRYLYSKYLLNLCIIFYKKFQNTFMYCLISTKIRTMILFAMFVLATAKHKVQVSQC